VRQLISALGAVGAVAGDGFVDDPFAAGKKVPAAKHIEERVERFIIVKSRDFDVLRMRNDKRDEMRREQT